jgi:hypothetical protein
MPTIEIDGRITDEGTLEMELPTGLAPGSVHITIETSAGSGWTPEELESALRVEPWSGRQIVEGGLLGGWADQGIGDAEEWVAKQRRQRGEQNQW